MQRLHQNASPGTAIPPPVLNESKAIAMADPVDDIGKRKRKGDRII
jgi:hypothetical protein